MDNGVPGCLALTLGNVIFPGPAPQPELFDKVQIRHNATHHNPFLYLKVTRYSCANAALRLLEYIGRDSDSKKVFENLLFGKAVVFPSCIGHAGFPTRIKTF